jgi:dsDNA-specific endonuclease/ATPase MutS2
MLTCFLGARKLSVRRHDGGRLGSVRVTGEEDDFDPDAVVELPIDGTLDLHAFRPADVRDLVGDYLDECRARGILEVRIIHGKGTGALRRTVHAVLERRADVVEYGLAPPGPGRGGWGATLVTLRPSSTA